MKFENNRKVKVGVVGCGVVASAYYLPYLMRAEDIELIAVCDVYKVRVDNCIRLFGAKEGYLDYYEMIDKADIEAVFILTAPGTHVPFALKAVEKGKHILLQKPMATNLVDALKIAEAVKDAGVKAVIEPSSNTSMMPQFARLRKLVVEGVLGDPIWFSMISTGPSEPHPSLASNPFGAGAFFNKDSGGMMFDFPYAPSSIVSVLGACKKVTGMATIAYPDDKIVPDHKYDEFLSKVTDPEKANYWYQVFNEERTQKVKMEAPDNVFCQYEMVNGAIGTLHVGRTRMPTLPHSQGSPFQIFGTEGNLICGVGHIASIISKRKDLLPEISDDGWYHYTEKPKNPGIEVEKTPWPVPAKGGFNYYHESSKHLVECILNDRDPIINVDWGLHITEMMYGVMEAARTGQTYEMTTFVEPATEPWEEWGMV